MLKILKLNLLVSAVWFVALSVSAQSLSSPDAIAIRVVPNPDHLSAVNWYKQNNFTGSPQSVVVDGYEGVRDGRTVYVHVANIDELGRFWTNIYLISYNQEAEDVTRDIFGQVLKHWKFNSNLAELGACRGDAAVRCLDDAQCPVGDVCDSEKARAVRDTRRLADLTDMQTSLNAYRAKYGFFPKLSAGSYLPNRSLSVWPSWKNEFSAALGAKPKADPVNRLGPCAGYDETTCWNEATKSFATALPALPPDSLVYLYTSDPAGSSGTVCGSFESGFSVQGAPVCSLDACLDFDGDGYGYPGSASCSSGSDLTDCNDSDVNVWQSAPEFCGNGVDDDCDGLADCFDAIDCAGSDDCAPALCVPNSTCDCDPPCTLFSQDPGCGCADDGAAGYDGTGCCPSFCTYLSDPDCPVACDGACNGACSSPSCSLAQDPDCACGADSRACCPSGCTRPGDMNCPEICSDSDGDGYMGRDAALCPSGNDCNDSPASGFAVHPGADETCNSIDDDCDGDVDEGFTMDTCDASCLGAGYVYLGLGNCCGDGADEARPYQSAENLPNDHCDDGYDNDCDGNPDEYDSDCMTTCDDDAENNHIWAANPLSCNQCFTEGSQDDDQFGEDWSPYPGMADRCDADCGTVAQTVQLSDYENGNETRCDGVDNNCDGCVDGNMGGTVCQPLTRNCGSAVGICTVGTETCSAGAWINCTGVPPQPAEDCATPADDDCDNDTNEGCVNYCQFDFIFPCVLY